MAKQHLESVIKTSKLMAFLPCTVLCVDFRGKLSSPTSAVIVLLNGDRFFFYADANCTVMI